MKRTERSRKLMSAVFATMALVAGCGKQVDVGKDDGSPDGGTLPGVLDGICGDGIDDNSNGVIDEGCPCSPGEQQSCFVGSASARQLGICRDGTMLCQGRGEFGTWGDACEGSVLPEAESCNELDDDCDGTVDEGCACPVVGETRPCGAGSLPLPCKAGEQTCTADGAWSECQGEVLAELEECGDGVDNDCDGNVDEQCGCVPEHEVCDDGVDNDCDGVVDERCEEGGTGGSGGTGGTGGSGGTGGAGGSGGTGGTGGGPVDCTGVSDWEVKLPVELYSGDFNSSPGGMARGSRLASDRDGVLMAGHAIGGKVAVGSVVAGSTAPNPSGGAIPQNIFVLGLTRSGEIRFGYAPEVRPFDPPTPYGEVPGVFANGLASDGSGGFWLSGAFRGIMVTAPGKEYATPVPTSYNWSEADGVLIHGNASGTLADSRVFGRDGQLDAFGEVAVQGDDLMVACTTSDFFQVDGVPLLPPSANAMSFLTMQPKGGSYAPSRIDYADTAGGNINAVMVAANGGKVRFGVGGAGVLELGGNNVGASSQGITALLAPGAAGYDVQSFIGTEGYYTYATAVRINGAGELLLSGGLRGTVTFGGDALSTGGASADDGFGAFVASFRADGTHRWSRAIVPAPVDPFHSVSGQAAIDDEGNVFFAGTYGNKTGSTLDLGDGASTLPEEAVVFAVYDASGALIWSKIEDNSGYSVGKVLELSDVQADGCGGFYVTGSYWMGTWARGAFVRHVMPQ
ncbi:MAG: hypothetical protein CVU63_08490 [Deltaproteobacteria bacterium HGW-Deltaproteobacteria-20]|nr:MAG: hypothetical protein CVU63_08490 [Deltaproteobacteria bacterium HGW-Deltaproteobacteria-20]